jgi:hypothetical protein
MTAELVAKLGSVDYAGQKPCIPQCAMAQLAIALSRPRRRLIGRVLELLRKTTYGQNTTQRTS